MENKRIHSFDMCPKVKPFFVEDGGKWEGRQEGFFFFTRK